MLACALPVFRHLQHLELHQLGDDVLTIGRSLRPGPCPFKWRFMCIAVSRIDGKRCTAGWDNKAIVSAFSATCLHAQLGAASWVSFLIYWHLCWSPMMCWVAGVCSRCGRAISSRPNMRVQPSLQVQIYICVIVEVQTCICVIVYACLDLCLYM